MVKLVRRRGQAVRTISTRRIDSDRDRTTYPYRTPRPQPSILNILHSPPGIPYDTMYSKSRQAHTRNTLKHRPLYHHGPVILNRRYMSTLLRLCNLPRRHIIIVRRPRTCSLLLEHFSTWVQQPLVPTIRLVSLMPDVANQIGPGYAVGAADEPRMRDGTEGLANVGGVGDIAMGAEEDGAQACGVGGVAVVC